MKALVLLLVHRAVDVVGAAAAGPRLVVARLEPGDRHVDRLWRWMIGAMASKKASSPSPGQLRDGRAQRRRGQRARGDDDALPNPPAAARRSRSRSMVISGCAASRAVTSAEKPSRSTASAPPAGNLCVSPAAITSEPRAASPRAAGRRRCSAQSSERNELEQTSSARSVGLVRLGDAHRAHFVNDHGHAGRGDLPRGLRPRESAAYNM